MAIVTNAQNTYQQKGIREDLADMVYRISPEETPFQSNISTRKQSSAATFHEWQTQALVDPTVVFALEGDNSSAAAATQRTRIGNRLAIIKKIYAVTGTAMEVTVAGIENELDQQRLLKGLELKRDMECALLQNNAYLATQGTATARQSAGLAAYVTNYGLDSAITQYTVGSGDGLTAWNLVNQTTLGTLNMTVLNTANLNATNSGGRPNMGMLSTTQKVNFSRLALGASAPGVSQTRYNMSQVTQAALIGAADIWQSDFGQIQMTPNVQMSFDTAFLNRTIYLVDTRYVGVAFLGKRRFLTERLAKTGDAEQEHVLSEFTLEVSAPKAHAILPQLANLSGG